MKENVEDFVDKLPPAGDIFSWISDKNLMEIKIFFSFTTNCFVKEIKIETEKWKISGGFIGGPRSGLNHLLFCLETSVPKSLYDDSNLINAKSIIIGYISRVLPFLNNEIVKQKSENMNLLLKRYGTLDINDIFISNGVERKRVERPITIGDFPFEKISNDIFFHDLMNAIQSFFYNDYNETIRKLITSIDSYIKKNHREGKNFKKKLNTHFKNCNSFINTIIEDIKYMYDIRNMIVHEGKSINPKDFNVVDLFIGCTFYFYKFVSKNEKESVFFHELEIHYITLKRMILGELLSDYESTDGGESIILNDFSEYENHLEQVFNMSSYINEVKGTMLDYYF